MKSEGGAVAVGGEDAELDVIFGIADGVRLRGFPVGHFASTYYYLEGTFLLIDYNRQRALGKLSVI